MIVWSKEAGAKLFVNGTELGEHSSVTVKSSRKMTKDILFNLGRKAIGDRTNQGKVSLLQSSFTSKAENICLALKCNDHISCYMTLTRENDWISPTKLSYTD